MLIAREKYTYYLLYFIKLLKDIVDNIVNIIRDQDFLIIIARTLILHTLYTQYIFIIYRTFFEYYAFNCAIY